MEAITLRKRARTTSSSNASFSHFQKKEGGSIYWEVKRVFEFSNDVVQSKLVLWDDNQIKQTPELTVIEYCALRCTRQICKNDPPEKTWKKKSMFLIFLAKMNLI